jgi:cobalt-zinc-cadmium efflux system outer membrane protein
MALSITDARLRRVSVGLMTIVALMAGGSVAWPQAPQIDVQGPPGLPEARGRLGPAIGASGTSSFEDAGNQGRPLGGRPGPSVSRAPVGGVTPRVGPREEAAARFRPPVLEPADIPRYGELEQPAGPEDLGPENGLTLDGAIERLLQQNLNLLALKFEIPMAEADVLTASLRANPIFYADTQLVPYGNYSPSRPGGQTQYDVNVTYPLDVTRKRRARTLVAAKAKRVTEAQFQDAVRLQIDNLYTAYVDVVAAGETLRYSQAYVIGITRLLRVNESLFRGGAVTQSAVDAIRAQVEQAQLQVREAQEALVTTTRTLALLLNLTRPETDALQVRSALRDLRPLPASDESLVQTAMASRPDLLAYRLGIERAQADVRLAKANRYTDVYLLYQPYTLQDNRPLGLKSPTSWAVGVTATLPIYNRNQGNIARSELNVKQTQLEAVALERQVEHDVEAAIREFRLSQTSVVEMEREILPASRRVRDTTLQQFEGGEVNALDFLEAQRDYNEVVRKYRDALVRHRRSMLDLNTAVGTRVLP